MVAAAQMAKVLSLATGLETRHGATLALVASTLVSLGHRSERCAECLK